VVPPPETEGGEVVLGGVCARCPSTARSGAEGPRQVLGYFENQVHRMATRRIGRGLGDRLRADRIGLQEGHRQADERGGMRWGEDGADEMVPPARPSRQWRETVDAYWHPNRN